MAYFLSTAYPPGCSEVYAEHSTACPSKTMTKGRLSEPASSHCFVRFATFACTSVCRHTGRSEAGFLDDKSCLSALCASTRARARNISDSCVRCNPYAWFVQTEQAQMSHFVFGLDQCQCQEHDRHYSSLPGQNQASAGRYDCSMILDCYRMDTTKLTNHLEMHGDLSQKTIRQFLTPQ